MNPTIAKIFKFAYPAFVGLGAYRGVKSYNYEYKTDIIRYEFDFKNYGKYWDEERIKNNTPRYFYGGCALRGVLGTALYASPLGVFMVFKEIYRLEVNLRGLESEKNSETYNNLLL